MGRSISSFKQRVIVFCAVSHGEFDLVFEPQTHRFNASFHSVDRQRVSSREFLDRHPFEVEIMQTDADFGGRAGREAETPGSQTHSRDGA